VLDGIYRSPVGSRAVWRGDTVGLLEPVGDSSGLRAAGTPSVALMKRDGMNEVVGKEMDATLSHTSNTALIPPHRRHTL
jgi:hypothetical protein